MDFISVTTSQHVIIPYNMYDIFHILQHLIELTSRYAWDEMTELEAQWTRRRCLLRLHISSQPNNQTIPKRKYAYDWTLSRNTFKPFVLCSIHCYFVNARRMSMSGCQCGGRFFGRHHENRTTACSECNWNCWSTSTSHSFYCILRSGLLSYFLYDMSAWVHYNGRANTTVACKCNE